MSISMAHGEVAEAFLDYVWSVEGQTIFAKHGFRPVNAEVAKSFNINVEATPAADAAAGEVTISFPPITEPVHD